MISCPSVEKSAIRSHYNVATVFYRMLWGRHIHHGLWTDKESPAVAQERLTEALAAHAEIPRGARVLDAGCGMGGSSIHLARTQRCDVTGVTISPLQRRWATAASYWYGVRRRAKFLCGDVENASFNADSFDVVWSIECTEHLFDKRRFFQNAAAWVRPGGTMAICAWLAGDEPHTDEVRRLVYDVCEGFFCPSLGTAADYRSWMETAGLEVRHTYDWTDQVTPTWEICARRVRRAGMPLFARLIDPDAVLFLKRFETILKAYRTGAMRYGCFIARKPDLLV